jgi:hypothetical protein
MKKNSVFIKLLKKHMDIDKSFIDIFFNKFKVGGELDFNIKDNDIIKYLGITMRTLRNRLSNTYSKNELYLENIDYIKIKSIYTNKIIYMLNYQCFEKIALGSDSVKSETIKLYFIKLRQFITNNHELIYQALENKDELDIYSGYESIYFIAIDERKPNILKIGRTNDIVKRLRNYNVGRIKEVDLKYFALVRNPLLIENCIKLTLKNKKVIPNREIFNITPTKLKKIIDKCYCLNTSSKKNEQLYKEVSDLLGLYAYTKDKINIKPYIIIGNAI